MIQLIGITFALLPVLAMGRLPKNGTTVWYQQRLYSELLQDYMEEIRPAYNTSYSVPVKINEFQYWTINSLEEQQQVMSSGAFLSLTWEDFRLTWNPSDHGSIEEIELPITLLWRPDIYIDNAKDAGHLITTCQFNQLAVVSSTGMVRWEQILNLRTFCYMDLSHFPYDTHNCTVYMSLWAYDNKKAHLVPGSSFREDPYNNGTVCSYIVAHDWTVNDCGIVSTQYAYEVDGNDLTYPVAGYWIIVERARGFASHLFVAPSVALCLINPVTFLLPPASKERIVFGVGMLLSNVFLLGELIRFIPTAYPNVPLLGKYMLSNIVMSCISLLLSATIINIWGRRTTRVGGPPQIIVTIFIDNIGRWLLVRSDEFSESLEEEGEGGGLKQEVTTSNTPHAENLQLPMDTAGRDRLRQAQVYVRKIGRLQWHQLIVVIDRLCLILYLVILISLTFSFAQYM